MLFHRGDELIDVDVFAANVRVKALAHVSPGGVRINGKPIARAWDRRAERSSGLDGPVVSILSCDCMLGLDWPLPGHDVTLTP